MCYFYRMHPAELDRLSTARFSSMWHMITVIEAQESLNRIKELQYPNLKPHAKKEYHRSLIRQAYPSMLREKRQLTLSDLQKELSQGRT